jgi:hypothetical protein
VSNEDEKIKGICQGKKRGGENGFVKGQFLLYEGMKECSLLIYGETNT